METAINGKEIRGVSEGERIVESTPFPRLIDDKEISMDEASCNNREERKEESRFRTLSPFFLPGPPLPVISIIPHRKRHDRQLGGMRARISLSLSLSLFPQHDFMARSIESWAVKVSRPE